MSDKIRKANSSKMLKKLEEARIQDELNRLTNGASFTQEEKKF